MREFVFGTAAQYRELDRVLSAGRNIKYPNRHLPGICTPSNWIAYSKEISQVLSQSEELLNKHAPADYKEGHRTPYERRNGFNPIEYAQKLDVYFCVLYMFTEEWDKLEKRLEQLLLSTERNVQYLLMNEDAEEYAASDDWAEFHYPGTDTWEPLNWLYREFIPSGMARKLYAQTYDKYVRFLSGSETNSIRSKAFNHFYANAKKRLSNICDLILDEIEDELDNITGDKSSLIVDKEMYEVLLQKCSESTQDDDNSENNMQNGEDKESKYYHQEWWLFTQKLRSLMNDYPTLPVVVSSQVSIMDGKVDCAVAYVHDHRTGKFKEKIIAIHSALDNFPEMINDYDIDLPF